MNKEQQSLLQATENAISRATLYEAGGYITGSTIINNDGE